MLNKYQVAYSFIYSDYEGISLGLEAGNKGYTSYIELDNIKSNLSLIIWTTSSELDNLDDYSLFGENSDELYFERQEDLLRLFENFSSGFTYTAYNGYEIEFKEVI